MVVIMQYHPWLFRSFLKTYRSLYDIVDFGLGFNKWIVLYVLQSMKTSIRAVYYAIPECYRI